MVAELKGEISLRLGIPTLQVCWDVEKFYDAMDPEAVTAIGCERGYSPTVMYMGIIMHLATRILKCQGFFSDWIVPTRTILAGCVQSLAWSR
eukprot:8800249-Heterocapsa_arctica.AAC.1